ncbi:MAG: recombinase family protein [Deltaproteobacteria bacterium]|jgi:DNA invertase Pin-like site-specific DNA recombinase|nr:recombinase family protein [Deltaproteobacteria bacterium]
MRPGLDSCLKAIRPGDTLVVWKLDRLGRSLKDLISIVSFSPKQGVAFESLTEKIDTSSSSGQQLFDLFAALADFEMSLIRERATVSLAAARKRGLERGRPIKLDKEKLVDARKMVEGGLLITKAAKLIGVSRSLLYSKIKHHGKE